MTPRTTCFRDIHICVSIGSFHFIVLFSNMAVLIRPVYTAEILNCVARTVLDYVLPATARPLIASSNPIHCMRVHVFELLRCSAEALR